MATKSEKIAFNEAIKTPKDDIEKTNKVIKDILVKKRKMANIKEYLNFEMAMEHIKIVMLYLNMNDSSMEILKLRNSSYLDKARKEYYKVIQLLEEVVGDHIDRPLSENKDYLAKVANINIHQILMITKKISFVFETLIEKVGENSKWQWSFVDLHVRVSNVIKNMINFSEIEKYRNFKSEFFKDRQELLKLCKRSLEEAAKQARNKYELGSQAPEDISKAVGLLTALKQIHSFFGENEDAHKTKNVIDALHARLESDERKKEKSKKTSK